MKQQNRKYIFEQELTLRKFYELKRERKVRRFNKFLKEVYKPLIWIKNAFFILIKMFVMIFVSVVFGSASEHIIYRLNQPLGLGYAHYASYAVCGLVMFLLFNSLFKEKR